MKDREGGAEPARGSLTERMALVAPDSFKGTFSAPAIAAAIATGLRSCGCPAAEMPLADGGEGTTEALLSSLPGELLPIRASDPLGRPVDASFALLADGRTAIVETAQASGLSLLAEEERDPWAASTRGTGEMIVAAVEAGAERVVVTVGGSATTDGGAGALEALHEAGVSVEMHVLCDVRTAYEDAAALFGRQKGADEALVQQLVRRLDRLAESFRRDPRRVPMTGCAGGLSGALWAEHNARLHHGASYVLETTAFDGRMRSASFVVTGEGRIDEQTLEGKVVYEVARRCRRAGVACHAVVGQIGLNPPSQRVLNLASLSQATTLDELELAGRALVAER